MRVMSLCNAACSTSSVGAGIHKCIGSLMARTVVREAVQGFFERFPDARPGGEVTWIRNLGLRGMATFPVRLGAG